MTAILSSLDTNSSRRTMNEAEWELRLDLAAAFRTGYRHGWNEGINNHITVRIPGRDEFLMNPYGFGWSEITASMLVRTSFSGEPLSHPGAKLAPAGLNFHSGILKARPAIGSVLHVHPRAGVVISALKDGLMILDQPACALHGEVGEHDFEGLAQEADEVPRILADLGDKHLLLMRNHGLLSVGATIGEAFLWMSRLVAACELQERVMSTGGAIRPMPQAALETTRKQYLARRGEGRTGAETEWAFHRRVTERLDPDFAN